MTTEGGLHIRHHFIPFAACRHLSSLPGDLDDYERQAIHFCHRWLKGTAHFTFHTSGSTGTPKRIKLSRRLMAWSARNTLQYFGLQKGDSLLVNMNIAFVGGAMMLVRAMEGQLHAYVQAPSRLPLSEIPGKQFDFYAFVPMQLQSMLHEAPRLLASLKQAKGILIGGAPLSKHLEKQLLPLQACMVQTYGMTETASHVALRPLGKPLYEAMPGVHFSCDKRQCLVVHTPHLPPLVTNDRVRLHDATHFEWLGRIDNVINSGGIKIQIEQVEEATARLLEEMSIRCPFFATGIPDPLLGQKLVLVFPEKSLPKAAEEQLLQALRQRMEHYKAPKAVLYQAYIPRSPSGKILRQLLDDSPSTDPQNKADH
jgi:O-succinylbenzoic acid--CoA ligase